MITIFCDFCQFSAKKLAFFSKTNDMITIFAKSSSSLSEKRQYFLQYFGEIFLNNIGPRKQSSVLELAKPNQSWVI
jgi:hypothetical protein